MAAGQTYNLTQLFKVNKQGVVQNEATGEWSDDGINRDFYFIEVKWGRFPIQKWLDGNDPSHYDEIAIINSADQTSLLTLVASFGDELIDALIREGLIDPNTYEEIVSTPPLQVDLLPPQ